MASPEDLRSSHEPNVDIKPQTRGPAIPRRMKDPEDLASGPLDPQALSFGQQSRSCNGTARDPKAGKGHIRWER